ncbi:hypothetical protein IE53DRAFT_385721 [Violaceomyces palustris]|uniref:Uncharacterized protein n=1 Tax=Violaceomyces palustris TaxID=1673888 RepID=A0ACD0P1G8_9BASI|nr:hypothetical protein IE53DRAFT_385721 [Violaceomyces palustris]
MSGNPPNPHQPPPLPSSPWTEYRNPQGRAYWYHNLEKRSVWEKPHELKSEREKALERTPWREYKSGDRSYYVHSETKQSTWTLPAELKELLEKYPDDATKSTNAVARTAAPLPSSSSSPSSSTPNTLTASNPSHHPVHPPNLSAVSPHQAVHSPYHHAPHQRPPPPMVAAASSPNPVMVASPQRVAPSAAPAISPPPAMVGGVVRPPPHQPIYSGPPPGFGPSPSPSLPPSGTPTATAFSPTAPIQASPVPPSIPNRPPPPMVNQIPSGPSNPGGSAPPSTLPPPGPSSTLPARPVGGPSNLRTDERAAGGAGGSGRGGGGSSMVPGLSKENAEAAFISLLDSKGVDVDWTWEVTMRAIITEPLYKALKTIAERKNAFNKYIEDLKRRRAEERAAKIQLLRPELKERMANHQKIKPYSSFETVKKFLGESETWSKMKDDDEARAVYDVVIKDLKEIEVAHQRELRHRNMDMLMSLLKTFEADVMTRWRDAQRTVLESAEFAQDAHLKDMDVADMLIVFDEHMKTIEKETSDARKKEQEVKRRGERKNRDAFKALLGELKDEGALDARTTWGDIYPRLKDDERLLRLVGQPGSSPIDLFYDVVDQLEIKLEEHSVKVEGMLKSKGVQVEDSTSWQGFSELVGKEAESMGVTGRELELIYKELHSKAVKRASDERRRQERRLRYQIDDLRYAFKKMEPPLDIGASYDEILPRISGLAEFKEVESEEARRTAWEKFVKRQKEKMAEAASGGGGGGKDRTLREGTEFEGENGGGGELEREKEGGAGRKRKERSFRDGGRDGRDGVSVEERERERRARRARYGEEEGLDGERGHRRERREREERERERNGRETREERRRERRSSVKSGNEADGKRPGSLVDGEEGDKEESGRKVKRDEDSEVEEGEV